MSINKHMTETELELFVLQRFGLTAYRTYLVSRVIRRREARQSTIKYGIEKLAGLMQSLMNRAEFIARVNSLLPQSEVEIYRDSLNFIKPDRYHACIHLLQLGYSLQTIIDLTEYMLDKYYLAGPPTYQAMYAATVVKSSGFVSFQKRKELKRAWGSLFKAIKQALTLKK